MLGMLLLEEHRQGTQEKRQLTKETLTEHISHEGSVLGAVPCTRWRDEHTGRGTAHQLEVALLFPWSPLQVGPSQAVDFHHLPKGSESYRSSWAPPHHPLLPLVGPRWRGVQHR